MGHKGSDDLLALIGTGKQSARQVANKLLKETSDQPVADEQAIPERLMGVISGDITALNPLKPKVHKPSKGSSGIVIKGLDEVLVRLSHCCNPVPGDEIIGFVTRGRGVTVHRKDCPNAKALMGNMERIIEVDWASSTHGGSDVYNVEIFIEAVDRLRLYQDVTVALGSSGVNILNATMSTHKDGIVEMRYLFEVSEIAHIEKILRELMAIDGVIDARRTIPGEAAKKRRKGA
jgi:GTP pyrophosphokinase